MDQMETFEQGGNVRTGVIDEGQWITEVYPFDKYDVEIKLGLDGTFLGIVGISLNKDFLSYIQKSNSIGYIDLDKYYSESPDEDLE